MTPKDIDTPRLVADLNRHAAESRALKRVLRRTWTRPMGEEQRAFESLRRRITSLCILRAHSRGRVHVHSASDQERVATRVAAEYRRLEEA